MELNGPLQPALPILDERRDDLQGSAKFSSKGYIVSILGFVGKTVSVTNTQLYFYSLKAAIDSIGMVC